METKHKRLTTEQLEAIRKRAEAATGKEWTDFDGSRYSGLVCEYDQLTEDISRVIAECRTQADAEFIAEAKTDIPALLAEVERLQDFEKRVSSPLDIEGIAEDGRLVKMKRVVFDFDRAVISNDSE